MLSGLRHVHAEVARARRAADRTRSGRNAIREGDAASLLVAATGYSTAALALDILLQLQS